MYMNIYIIISQRFDIWFTPKWHFRTLKTKLLKNLKCKNPRPSNVEAEVLRNVIMNSNYTRQLLFHTLTMCQRTPPKKWWTISVYAWLELFALTTFTSQPRVTPSSHRTAAFLLYYPRKKSLSMFLFLVFFCRVTDRLFWWAVHIFALFCGWRKFLERQNSLFLNRGGGKAHFYIRVGEVL